MYDFDEIIDRRGTRCDKVDSLKDMFGRSDLIPMWVADMDFRTPDFITDALRRRLDHPILGYPLTGSDYFRIVSDWVYSLHGWRVDPSAFRFIPGIVKGLILAEHCLLQRGDRVIIQPPVYHRRHCFRGEKSNDQYPHRQKRGRNHGSSFHKRPPFNSAMTFVPLPSWLSKCREPL